MKRNYSIQFENILSYSKATLELGSLNVLIGANTAGKSNLIEIISLLAATPNNLLVPIREGGGVTDWLWKGMTQSVMEGMPKQSLGTRGKIRGFL